jgi:hypothetical protein
MSNLKSPEYNSNNLNKEELVRENEKLKLENEMLKQQIAGKIYDV